MGRAFVLLTAGWEDVWPLQTVLKLPFSVLCSSEGVRIKEKAHFLSGSWLFVQRGLSSLRTLEYFPLPNLTLETKAKL